MKVLALLLLCCLPAVAQNTDAAKYASRPLVLAGVGDEIRPVVFTLDGQSHLEFVPDANVKAAILAGGKPVVFGDVLSLLNANIQAINKLQAENAQLKSENDKLWKVAMKDAPHPETVVIQQPVQSGPSVEQIAAQEQADANMRRQQAIQNYMLMQNSNRQQNINVNVTNCTRFPALCVGR